MLGSARASLKMFVHGLGSADFPDVRRDVPTVPRPSRPRSEGQVQELVLQPTGRDGLGTWELWTEYLSDIPRSPGGVRPSSLLFSSDSPPHRNQRCTLMGADSADTPLSSKLSTATQYSCPTVSARISKGLGSSWKRW